MDNKKEFKPAHLKVAVVYDWVDKWGGAERVLLTLFEIFPTAVLFTSYYDSEKAHWAKNLKIIPSFMQKLPNFIRQNRILSIPFYPFAFESFDFQGYDLVVSVTSSFAKSVITRPETTHICYLLTPTRFLWQEKQRGQPSILKLLTRSYINYLKTWDRIASNRPDKYLAISKTVQKRVESYYKKDSDVVYPPFDIDYWDKIKKNTKHKVPSTKCYLVVSRLEPYKNVDVVIRAFNEMPDNNLIVIGSGSQERALKNLSGGNVKFIKDITDAELGSYYSSALALIMMQEEDFGYTSLEAQFFGCPVIAYRRGGASETVIDGQSGILIDQSNPAALKNSIDKFEDVQYTLKNSTLLEGPKNAEKFSKARFIKQFLSFML
ncbi:hypothetical protein A2690_02545 [Candidatus Roizmanbacteria bacterium RIFCSPHIGHO2_01_FULL_39_12b]|uniref:Glycosyl transferase family 1 domain-containing protein n=1 Tax=Candidatus Roizmanbacteria bacterium RIFCSPHIGHO2_01_FULL_39_12b TaxID=1802030 RepID=A0A1F7GDT9_9BACT|nr:MAG: hypothetical protein A2690_02545 [Candidatus Roizmanbacteria bacterium RIFCSPHIGHO2_01_FULL_39_12b]OGK46623.1 MAG: hypothetical protein A3B46_00255 [Candidatus Roizmanbacteria bacterium RIFCSPLOWO2_01_FULL_39_19]